MVLSVFTVNFARSFKTVFVKTYLVLLTVFVLYHSLHNEIKHELGAIDNSPEFKRRLQEAMKLVKEEEEKIEGYRRAMPWLEERHCEPVRSVGFLKMHKCGSSSIQNILLRYGDQHNLTFVLPGKTHIFNVFQAFHATQAVGKDFQTERSNIFAVHAKWDRDEFEKVLLGNPVFFTIVRFPPDIFHSFFEYFGLEKRYHMTMDEFVAKYKFKKRNKYLCMTYNTMSCDLGALPENYINDREMLKFTKKKDEEFDLVLLLERYEESLVLLKHLLCWSYEDMASMQVNNRYEKAVKHSARTDVLLQDRLAPDFLLYKFFKKKFERVVQAFGEERMASEVEKLRAVTKRKIEQCNIIKSIPHFEKGKEPIGFSTVFKYSTTSKDPFCINLIKSEPAFIDYLKLKQTSMLKKVKKTQV